MNDLLPADSSLWQYVEGVVTDILARYGYQEIRFPIVESTELFKRSIGEVTDIVEKEMYTFDDRNGDSLTLRPEGTACCVRACEENGLLYNQTQRLWYMGPMFRHERPQKGRYRQFHQIGVETFGIQGPDIDAEVLVLSARILRELGVAEHVQLQINSLGSSDARAAYKEALVAYLSNLQDQLDEDSKRRLSTNPMRILDSKDANTQALLNAAPVLLDYLDEESRAHFEGLKSLLDAAGIRYQINPRLVRGLDYYGKTAFEWVTDKLGAQSTVCAGGRYDGLVEQLGGKSTPAVGFGIGLERLILTAAHCLFDSDGNAIDASRFEFRAGLRDGRAEATRDVIRAIAHPEYVHNLSSTIGPEVAMDIAVLELDQPIRSTRIHPYLIAQRPLTGDQVGVVSYGRGREEAASLQEVCSVLGRQTGIIVMTCDVDFGSSGAPVFTVRDGETRIASVVSAKAQVNGQKVSLGTSLDGPLSALLSHFATLGPARPGGTQRLLGTMERNETGAKFVSVN